MKRLASLMVFAFVMIAARADAGLVEDADKSVDEEMKNERYAFCKKPRRPFFTEQQALCPLADEPGCEGFAEACKAPLAEQAKKDSSSSPFLDAIAPLLKALLYILVIATIIAMTRM